MDGEDPTFPSSTSFRINFVQRQFRHCLLQPLVLPLKLLQTSRLVDLQSAVKPAPPVIALLPSAQLGKCAL